MASDAVGEGGWSLPPTDSVSSDADDEPVSESSMNDEVAQEDYPESRSQKSNDVAEEGSETPTVLELLRAFLNQGHLPLRAPLGRFEFQNLARSILGQSSVAEWVTSERNRTLLLRLPLGLSHCHFFSSFTHCFRTANTHLRLTNVLVEYDRISQHTRAVFLASLCYQIAAGFAYICETELHDNLTHAFQGFNFEWREQLLWTLLRTLLYYAPTKLHVLAVGIFQNAASFHIYASVVKGLADLCDATERRLKLLIALPDDAVVNIDKTFLLEVQLENEEVKNALFDDINSWITLVMEVRPRLKDAENQILSNVMAHYQNPAILMDYLKHLEARSYITRRQLELEQNCLSAPTEYISSVLNMVPEFDRVMVATALAVVGNAARPLTVSELATALAMDGPGHFSDTLSKNAPLDLEYDLHHCLAGLMCLDERSVCPHQSLKAFFDAKKTSQHPSWTIPDPKSHMKLAKICLTYISIWTESQEGRQTCNEDSSANWPLLDYAMRFWHGHYVQAVRDGVKDDQIQPLIEDWDLLRSWITQLSILQPWIEGMTGMEWGSKLSPPEIDASFSIGMTAAIEASLLATQVIPLMDGNEDTAVLWAVWQLDKSERSPVAWVERLQSSSTLSSLLKAIRLAPLKTFQLLATDHNFIQENAQTILTAAVTQGTTVVADYCLSMVDQDESFTTDLEMAWRSCARNGNFSLLKKLLDVWSSNVQLKNRLCTMLLREAIRYGRLKELDLVLSHEFDLDDSEDIAEDTSILELASAGGSLDIVQHLLEKRRDLLLQKWKLSPPLHWASAAGYLKIAKFLLARGVQINAKDEEGNTALQLAVRNGNTELVNLFMEVRRDKLPSGSMSSPSGDDDANMRDNEDDILQVDDSSSYNPLQEAVSRGYGCIVDLLLENSPPSTASQNDLLHIAANWGQIGLLRRLLKLDDIDINQEDDDQQTALHIAGLRGCVDAVEELIRCGAHAWTEDTFGDRPLDDIARVEQHDDAVKMAKLVLRQQTDKAKLSQSLSSAACNGRDEIVALLLDAGADKNYTSEELQRTALHHAAYNGQEGVVRLLLMRNVQVDPKDNEGNTPLSGAASIGCLGVIRLLLNAGACIETRNGEGKSPLDVAALRNDTEIVELFLERGAALKADSSPEEWSVLEGLVQKRYTKMVKLFLHHGKEYTGSPLLAKCFHIALRNEDSPTMLLLLENGADPDAATEFGTALHECAFYGNIKMAKVLMGLPEPPNVNERKGPYHTPLIAAVCKEEKPRLRRHSSHKGGFSRRFERRRNMLEYLVSEGADTTICGGQYGTLLNAGAACASEEILQYMLDDMKLPVSQTDREGRSAAHLACIASYSSVNKLKTILERGGQAMREQTDDHGRRLLHFACGHGGLELVQHLLEEGESKHINATDEDMWTSLHWACIQWDLKVVELLVRNSADTAARTKASWTPWHVAVFHGNEKFADVLDADKFRNEEGLPGAPGYLLHNYTDCEGCFDTLHSLFYTCEQCPNSAVCLHCYNLGTHTHDPAHMFHPVIRQ